MNKTTNTNLERAAELVWDAIKLIKREEYPSLRAILEKAFDAIDNQVDYEDERIAQEAE